MRLILDTNIFLDVALRRDGLAQASDQVLRDCRNERHRGGIAWHTLSNLFYILNAEKDRSMARRFIEDLLKWVKISVTGTASAQRALQYSMPDFEDALQAAAAVEFQADFIVTRNTKDFRNSPIRAALPEEILRK